MSVCVCLCVCVCVCVSVCVCVVMNEKVMQHKFYKLLLHVCVYIYVFSPCHIKAFYKKQCISCVSCSAVSDSFDPMICNLPARLLCPQWSICCPSKGLYPFLTLVLASNSFSHLLDPTTSFFSASWIITTILCNSNLTSFRKPSSANPTKRNHSCL